MHYRRHSTADVRQRSVLSHVWMHLQVWTYSSWLTLCAGVHLCTRMAEQVANLQEAVRIDSYLRGQVRAKARHACERGLDELVGVVVADGALVRYVLLQLRTWQHHFQRAYCALAGQTDLHTRGPACRRRRLRALR